MNLGMGGMIQPRTQRKTDSDPSHCRTGRQEPQQGPEAYKGCLDVLAGLWAVQTDRAQHRRAELLRTCRDRHRHGFQLLVQPG